MNTLYRFVLLAFPADFRRHHGAAMAQQFDEQRRAAKSRPVAHLTLWPRAIIDALRHGFGLRIGAPQRAPRRSRLSPDLRQAWRSLLSRKGSTTTSIALLAVALTVSTTIFSIVDAAILRPAPFPHPETLYEIFSSPAPGKLGQPYMPVELARLWEQRTDLFTAVGGYAQGGTALIGGDQTRQALGQVFAPPGMFAVIGVQPMAGRVFRSGEGSPGNDRVVILAEDVARVRYGSAAAAVGQPIVVNDEPMTVVGVMPPGFTYPRQNIQMWRPFDLATSAPGRTIQMVVRARVEFSRSMLNGRVAAVAPGIMGQAPDATARADARSAALRPVDETTVPKASQKSLWLLAGATMLLVLTAAANLSSLTMAQVFGRTRQMAIQSALGASRFRLVRQALAEQCIIGIGALVVALPLTSLTMTTARALMPDTLTDWVMHSADFDWRAIGAMVLLAAVMPILAGLFPAIAASRTSVVELLKQDTRSSTAGRGSRAVRQIMVVTEIVCAVVLLVTGALLVRSFVRLTGIDRGFDTTRLLYAHVTFPARAFDSAMSRRIFVDRAIDELRATPGVAAATLSAGVPPESGQINFGKMAIDGQPSTGTPVELPIYVVRPEFFAVTGIRIASGRPFDASDGDDHVIVSQSLASAFWPGSSPVGHRFRLWDQDPWKEVVGVAAEVRSDGLDDARTPFEAYMPLVQPPISAVSTTPVSRRMTYSGQATFVVRVQDPDRMVPAVRAALERVDRHAMIDRLAPVEALYSESLAQRRMLLWLMVAFSAAGLLVAAIGVYGVLASLVAQQMREIGVRLMLGAEPAAMSRRVFRGGLALAAAGGAIGIVAAAFASHWIGSVLFAVRATDVMSYITVAVVLGIAAIAAAWIPARRAASVDPAALLKEG